MEEGRVTFPISIRRSGFGRELALAAVLFTLLTVLRVGSRDVRLANAISDDHPVTWSKFSAHPERWAGDPIQIGGPFFVKATLQNRIPAFLLREFSLPPEYFADFLVWFQNVAPARRARRRREDVVTMSSVLCLPCLARVS